MQKWKKWNRDDSQSPPYPVQVRIDELKLLEPGWLDGKGVLPPKDGLDWLAVAFDKFYPDDTPRPYLFPTPEGRVLAEWTLNRWSLSLEIDLAKKTGEWHALQLDTDVEDTRHLDLADSKDWEWLAQQIGRFEAETP